MAGRGKRSALEPQRQQQPRPIARITDRNRHRIAPERCEIAAGVDHALRHAVRQKTHSGWIATRACRGTQLAAPNQHTERRIDHVFLSASLLPTQAEYSWEFERLAPEGTIKAAGYPDHAMLVCEFRQAAPVYRNSDLTDAAFSSWLSFIGHEKDSVWSNETMGRGRSSGAEEAAVRR
jgi:hypothetical protein